MEKRYAAPDEVLYHIGFSANDIKGAKIAILPVTPEEWKVWHAPLAIR